MYDEVRAEAESYVGLEVLKCFGRKAFRGVVESIIPPEPGDPDDDGSYWWKVKYEDGDEEDLSFSELKGILMEVNNVASKEVKSLAPSGKRRSAATPRESNKRPRAAPPSANPLSRGTKSQDKATKPARGVKDPSALAPSSGQQEVVQGDPRASGPEPEQERRLREEMGIRLGAVRRVHLPRPREVMLRHHERCKCWKCKAGIAPGKVKSGRRKGATVPSGGAGQQVKAAQAGERRASKALADCRCLLCQEVVQDPVTAPCGHSFCFLCLKVKTDEQLQAASDGPSRTSRRAAASASKLSCPKCSQGIGNWFKDGSAVPRNAELARVAAGVEAAAREATAALSEALAAQEANEGAEEGGQEENGDPEASEDGDAVAGEEEDVWNEEEDLPEDAILVGEMCKDKDGKEMGKDWRSKCWWEVRQIGRVHLMPDFAKPEDVELPEWSTSFDPNSAGEKRAKAKVEEALENFRQAFEEAKEALDEDVRKNGKLRDDGKTKSRRPDLVAQNMMKAKMQFIGQTKAGEPPSLKFGTLPGMQVGTEFSSRAEMMVTGMHSHWLAGICCAPLPMRKKEGRGSKKSVSCVVAITMSGGYEDDQDGGEFCKYTGEGGNDLLHQGRQYHDQVWQKGNLCLALNCSLGIPVRVIRKNLETSSFTKSKFVYDGLYYVRRYWQEVGVSGFYICKFQLERLADQEELVTASVHWRNQGGKALPQSQKAEDRPGYIMSDLSLGQERIPICVVNELDKNSEAWAPPPVPLKPCKDEGKDPVEDAKWPTDQEERSRAFVYTTRQIISKAIPKPTPALPLSDAALKRLNEGDLPYNGIGNLLQQGFCTYEQAPQANAAIGPACSAQLGIRYRLEVFRTKGKGWGVRSWDRIPVGAFVCEFTGEVLTAEDSHRRLVEFGDSQAAADGSKDNDAVRKKAEGLYNEYMFDLTIHGAPVYEHATGEPVPGEDHCYLDHQDPTRVKDQEKHKASANMAIKQAGLTVDDVAVIHHLDGKRAGSVARFLNHNHHEPNLSIQPCLWDHHDPRLVRLCMFAIDEIPPLTELTYDYGKEYEDAMFDGASLRSLKMGSR